MASAYPLPKRILDKIVAAVLLVLLSPVVLVVLAAMALDMLLAAGDRGSFLYRERRISNGRSFDLLKFRSLRADALRRAGGHARPHEADAANLTWAGRRLLKPWYLDELPQFVNVLRGDISLVGPRPWPPALVERQVAEGQDYRNRIVAGLTGPAQVTKGSASRYADLDLEYVERVRMLGGWALVRYDLGILRRTVTVIARGQGLNY
jgi:lipopolysaccharide/colanic/teichoic acid biosynthesis glycosyltransferase